MKKIVYLAVAFVLSSFAVNAQEKPKKVESKEKVEEVQFREIEIGDISIGGDLDKGVAEPDDDSNSVYAMTGLQVMPEYPGGASKLNEDILAHINPADNGAPAGTTVKVYALFIVEKDGSISNVKIARDPGYGFGKETEMAVRKIRKKWEPGIQNGKPVRVQYALPIVINVP